MGSPLEWYNLVFYIALVVGVLFALGSAFGVGRHDHDADHEPGHDVGAHDHGHAGKHLGLEKIAPSDASHRELHGHSSWFSDLLGVGRVPFTIIVMLLFNLFGGVGVMANLVLSRLLESAYLFFPLSAITASASALFLTGRMARLINRVMPTSESYNVTKLDLVGRTGKVVATAEGDYVVALVKDHEGNVQQISCRTGADKPSVGQEILVLEYERGKGQYLVEPFHSDRLG